MMSSFLLCRFSMFAFIFSAFLIILAYLTGSISSAVIVSKIFNLPDPRQEGSKNPGATNVLRLAGKKFAIIVLIVDMLKGTFPVLIGHIFGVSSFVLGWIGLAAVIGHIYPVFFNFEGGKGVATALGVLLGFQIWLGLLVVITWLITAFISRFSSLSSIVSLSLMPLFVLFFFPERSAFLPLLIITGLVLYQHQENFKRLWNKTEPKINLKRSV